MKKIFAVVALLAVIAFSFAGCVQKAAVKVQPQGVNQQAQKGQGVNFNTPEFKLRRQLTSLIRLQGGDTPLTKEQATKLIAIVNDIKAKDAIDETYANTQVEAINAVLTDAQKTALNARPQRGNNAGQNGQNPNMQRDGQNAPKNGQNTNIAQGSGQSNDAAKGQRNFNGQNGNGQIGKRQQMSLKDECIRVLADLQKVQ